LTKDEALRLALEALESVLANHKGAPVLPWIEAKDAIKAALVAKVEPVAWVHETGFLAFNPAVSRYAGMKLYTTPPQRTWVGLTDEEITDLYFDGFSISKLKEFARAIENKLKEKNT